MCRKDCKVQILCVLFRLSSVYLFVVCASSEDFGLDDVMDIELDFPSLSDSQNAEASSATRSLLSEVSLIVSWHCSIFKAQTMTSIMKHNRKCG